MKRFNVRVYGLWVNDSKEVLISKEQVRDQEITKFPGGGLEWGEGLVAALVREWKEEMAIDIMVQQHIYTTHFFQPSAFDESQVISVYYRVQPVREVPLFPYRNPEGDYFYFVPVNEELGALLSLPIDRHVAGLWTEWLATK